MGEVLEQRPQVVQEDPPIIQELREEGCGLDATSAAEVSNLIGTMTALKVTQMAEVVQQQTTNREAEVQSKGTTPNKKATAGTAASLQELEAALAAAEEVGSDIRTMQ